MNTEERYFDSKFKSIEVIEPRFQDMGENAFEICFVAEDEEGNDVEMFLEVSDRYGQGTLASKTQAEITIETLERLGYKHGDDLSEIGELVGHPCRIRAKMNNKGTQMNYYIVANNRTAIKDKSKIAARMKAVMKQMNTTKPATADTPFG